MPPLLLALPPATAQGRTDAPTRIAMNPLAACRRPLFPAARAFVSGGHIACVGVGVGVRLGVCVLAGAGVGVRLGVCVLAGAGVGVGARVPSWCMRVRDSCKGAAHKGVAAVRR